MHPPTENAAFEAVLARHLHPDFFFIQIGANDGIQGDPLRLYILKQHWRGLLIEPLPDVFAQLVANYKNEPQLVFENSAIAAHDGTVTFFRHPKYHDCSGLGTVTKLQQKAAMEQIAVPCLTWQTLIAKHKIKQVDLLQIDTEGYDLAVLRLTQFDPKPRVIRFETKNLPEADQATYQQFLQGHGYQVMPLDKKDAVAWLPDNHVV